MSAVDVFPVYRKQAGGSMAKPAAQSGTELLDAMQRLRDANVPPLTEKDVAEEVKAVRAAQNASSAEDGKLRRPPSDESK